jgi:hypothetical protein
MTNEVIWNVPPTSHIPRAPSNPVNMWTEQWTPFELGALLILRHNGSLLPNHLYPPPQNLSEHPLHPLDWPDVSTQLLRLPHLDPDLCPWAHRVATRDYSSLACEFQYCCIFADRELEAHMKNVMVEWRGMVDRRFGNGVSGRITTLEVVRLLFLAVFWEMKVVKILGRSIPDEDQRIKSEENVSPLARFFEFPRRDAAWIHWAQYNLPHQEESGRLPASQPVESYLSFDTSCLNETTEPSLTDFFKQSTSYSEYGGTPFPSTPFPSTPAPNDLETPGLTDIKTSPDTQLLQPSSTSEFVVPKTEVTFTAALPTCSNSHASTPYSQNGLPTPKSSTAATTTTTPQPQAQDQNMEASSSYDSDFPTSSPPPFDYDAAEGMAFFDSSDFDDIMEMQFP